MSPPETMPVQPCHFTRCAEPQHHARRVSYAIARAAYDEWYGPRYGRHQSFERLHERGGFGWGELIESGVAGVKPHQPVDWRLGRVRNVAPAGGDTP